MFLDAEHFFDGYRSDPAYALEVVRVAAEAGAEVVALCDTNGGMLPAELGDVVTAVAAATGARLGIHCHDDTACAVANTLTAVEAGVTHVQGTRQRLRGAGRQRQPVQRGRGAAAQAGPRRCSRPGAWPR